ncbi:transcriptional regulator [Streptomyces noursei ZPM]|nr:transcriptional regulator [Streptomyces noursei ZPM]AKA08239.1 transcriptional regulator [Streptomyces noursei ZPM]
MHTRIGRDGKARPVNSAEGRRLASTLLMEKPDASLREVAKAAGISTGTVRDVRQRLQRNENPVPPRQRRAELNAAQEVEIPATMDGGTSTAIGALDQKTATQALTRDPQLRMSEEGRLLLRLSHPEWSDRAVAAATGLAAKTVAAIRRRSATEEVPQLHTRIGRDGKARPVNSAEGRRLASTLLMEKPDASLREVAKAAGISTGTVRDVRQRLQRNENPVPPRQRRAELNAAQEVEIPATMDGGTSTAIGALDQKTATQALTRDPQLRMSEEGRLLLRLFATRVVDKQQRQRLIEWIPSRWRRTVTELAYSCSRDWYQFAKQLEVRDERKAADNEPFPI